MKKMKQTLTFLISGMIATSLNAGEIDMLIKKLAEKKVISYGEAQQIMTESAEKVRLDLARGKHSGAPKWAQKIKMKGDIRLRHQTERKGIHSDRRNRNRIRYRLGVLASPVKGFEVMAGLATGGTDSRSTNQTMQDGFTTKGIQLDYAYAQFTPKSWLSFKGGKFGIKKALWKKADLCWDSDIAVEGYNLNIKRKAKPWEFFFHAGYWILDEFKNSGSSEINDPGDPSMLMVQPGIKYSWSKKTFIKFAPWIYQFSKVKDNPVLPNSEGGNTTYTNAGGADVLKYDYDSTGAVLEIGFAVPGNIPRVPWMGLFAEYIKNSDPDKKNEGALAGFALGDKKVKKCGQAQIKYNYRHLESDAWLDIFPDSDSYSGETGIRGHEFVLKVGLAKNVTLGFDYYNTKQIEGAKTKEILQTDLVIKF